jgi:hypothetical protein
LKQNEKDAKEKERGSYLTAFSSLPNENYQVEKSLQSQKRG